MRPRDRLLVRIAIQEQMNAQAQLAIIRLRRARRQRRKQRTKWAEDWRTQLERQMFGPYHHLMVKLRATDQRAFKNFMRMPPEMFDELLDRVGPRLTKRTTNWRTPIEPGLKLALTLRHLASGDSYMSMMYFWLVPHNTISIIVREVCQAIFDEYVSDVLPVPTEEDQWRAIADGFMRRWQFPNTIGALDGKHVACKCPPRSGSLYFNHKKFYSVVLLALVDADYKFIWADIGGRGAASDAQLWNMSELKESVEDDALNVLNIPPPVCLPHDTEPVPYFILADDAFALKPSLMKPYSHRAMTGEERIFNYRLSRGRRVVENAFGILANRFRVLLTTMGHHPGTVRLIVSTCVVLHNLMRIRYPAMQNNLLDLELENGGVQRGAWRQGRQMADCRNARGNNIDLRAGKEQRRLLTHWVNSPVGSIPWQRKRTNLPPLPGEDGQDAQDGQAAAAGT